MRLLWSLCVLAVVLGNATLHADQYFVAAWNVENLFDVQDDPENTGDDEFLPDSPKQWTEERYRRKLENLARVIKKMNADKGPDVLGLCEIENLAVVKALVAGLSPLGRNYQIVHADSPDKRGIDCAILYDAHRMTLVEMRFTVVSAGKTRLIAGGEFEVGSRRLHLYMNHWPSQANPEDDRIAAAKALRGRLDMLLAADPKAEVIVMGDLNEKPGEVAVKDHLKTTGSPVNLPAGYFYNTVSAWQSDPQIGTYVYANQWQTIDQVIISPGLLDHKGLRWRIGSTQLVKFPSQIFTPSNPDQIPRPNRSYSGNQYHATGISDHLPVAFVIEN